MKKYSNLGITSIVTNSKLKIEIDIVNLANGFNLSPNNYYRTRVRRGKRKDFADFIARKIIEKENPDTGENLVMEMFEKVFEDVFNGNYCNEKVFDYRYETD